MKIAKLLVFGALFLLGSNVASAVDANVWQKPVPTESVDWVEGEEYYLLNTGSGLLFTQGNAWGTQASADVSGLKVKIESVEGMEGVYHITDYCESKSAWLWWWFVDDGISMYVDYNGQADHLWEITKNGDKVYRLSPSAQNPTVNNNTLFVGLNRTTDPKTTALTANNSADSGAFIDWQFLSLAVGEAYMQQLKVYAAAMNLKEALDKAEAIGANVAEPTNVYNNTNSTLEELQAALEQVNKAISDREEELVLENYDKATVANPVDVTKMFITNPSFVGNKYDGWLGSGFGQYNGKDNAERYNMNYDTYQILTGLKEGIYKLSVCAFYRAGNAQPAYDNFKAQNEQSKYAKLYAATSEDSLTTSILSPFTAGLTAQMTTGTWSSATDADTGETFWIPNNMEAADEFFKAGYCNDNAVIIAVSDGTLKIGVRKDVTIGGDWSIFDDFALTYYGNGDDAYQLILDGAIANLKDYSNMGETVYTQSYLDAYNSAAEALKSADSKEAIKNGLRAVQEAGKQLEENIDLWKQFQALRQEASECAGDEHLLQEYTDPINDWATFESEDMLAAHNMTNEELAAEIARVKEMIAEARRHPFNGADMTNLLVNPNFSNGQTGWTKVAAAGGNVTTGGPADNLCYEAWNNANFDIYQIVENAPKGVYEISVQGFYRYGRGDAAFNYYQSGTKETTPEGCPVFIYLNANQTPFTNVYGDPVQITDETFYSNGSNDYASHTLNDVKYYYPNGMVSAGIAFSNGMFTQSAYGLVAQEGDQIRIGVKVSSNQLNDSWCIWDNFKLTYRGFQADVVKPVLEKAIADGEASLNGAIGKDVVAALQQAIDEAKALVNGNDGEAMFAALTKLFDLQESVTKSKNLFATLEAANERLAEAIPYSVATSAIVNEAKALNADITSGLENHTYADGDVEGLINEINKMINRLGIPSEMEMASDDNPVECTTIIINPAYVDNNDNGWTGGAGFQTYNDAEMFSKNYDYFQLLQGLPEGTYKVSVTGFYRAGTPLVDYESYTADPTANNNAFLYAAVNGDTVSTPLHRLASQLIATETLDDGFAWAVENAYEEPFSMQTAFDIFQSNNSEGAPYFSNNNVIVKVGEDGKLVIGLKKNIQITDDWTIWTNWQLFYYGKNSSLTPSDNPLSIETAGMSRVANAEIFTVNGTRVNALQRGINIVRETLSDGTVRVRKINVR